MAKQIKNKKKMSGSLVLFVNNGIKQKTSLSGVSNSTDFKLVILSKAGFIPNITYIVYKYLVMSNFVSQEALNDDIISEILNSTEAMQTSTISATNIVSDNTPLQQNCNFQIVSNVCDMDRGVSSDQMKQNVQVALQRNYNTESVNFFNSQLSDMENFNKMNVRHVHIPYILNGELYQIQTQDGENVTVKCCHCPPDRVYRGSVRSTGNFHMHIKRRHPDLLEKLHNMKVNALLERRDRLMRNRKISHRNNRNRTNNANRNLNDICSFKNDEKPELSSISSTTLDSITESNQIHTHNLKIKTVFQRHQMQQREAEEMRNWRNTQYVVMAMDKVQADNDNEHPINYSFKPQENPERMDLYSLHSSQQQIQELPENINATQTPLDSLTTNTIIEPTNLSTCNTENNGSMHENHQNLLTTSSSISCPSGISSHQYEVEANRLYNYYAFKEQNLSVIKPEQVLLELEPEAIDLRMHTDSGIFLSSEDNDFVNDNNDNSINETDTSSTAAECINNSNDNNTISTVKWHELLVQVEYSLRQIQREIGVRNQIESNRIFLDIAKFKFLNPGFQFNW